MPDKSYIDINYIIKEEITDTNENKDLIEDNKNKINNNNEYNMKENIKKENNYLSHKNLNAISVEKNIPSILPKKIQLNPPDVKEEEDLAKKIFSKIFNRNQNEKNNNLIEIILPQKIKMDLNIENHESSMDNSLIHNYETFCVSFLITGLKSYIGNNSIIENSYNFVAPCGHKNCSLLLSFKPELIFIYKNKNSQISQELNYLVANLCFPLGIKICFEMNIDNKEKKIQKSQKIYYNVIKNEKDDIYYITTLQYFVKMEIKNFIEKYKFDIFSYYLQTNNYLKKDNNFKKAMTFISRLANDGIIYIPETISLVSKYPFYIPMKICLNNIIYLQSFQEKNFLVNHIINEVPIPQKLKQISFYIPSNKNPIILNNYFNIYKGLSMNDKSYDNNYYINDNLSISQINSKILLEKISIENIIILFQLLLLEQQILIVENDYEILSEIILILISLIYPLIWTNPFLPILSLNTVQFLQTPVPYIMGLDEYLLKYAYNSKKIYIGKEIIIYNIMTKNFILSRTKKKANKKDIIHEFKFNFLPEKIESFMSFELKRIKILMGNHNLNDIELDMEIRLVFIKTMILLIGDYNNYTFYTNDEDMPLFNKESFCESHKEKQTKLFLGQMVKTQLFNQFLLNERRLFFYNKKKNGNISNNINIYNTSNENNTDENIDINSYVDTSYFKKMILKYPELINNEKIRKSSIDVEINKNSRNLNRNKIFKKPKRSKSNNLLFNFEKKNNISNLIDTNSNINNEIPLQNEKKLTIDFTKMNSNQINNLTRSNNFKLQSEYNNNDYNDNIYNIKKSITKKYNNIIIKKSNKVKKYLLFPYFLPKIKKEDLNFTNQKKIEEKVLLYNKNNKYPIISDYSNNKIYVLPKSLNFNFSQINEKYYYIIETNNNMNENIKKNWTEKNDYLISESKSSIYKESESVKNIINIKSKQRKANNIKIIENEQKKNLIKKTENAEDIELINKCFISCCTNKHHITKDQLISLGKIFSNNYNKNYFANLIVPDMRIKNTNQHKQLISTSFDDLKIIMKICLEKLTNDEVSIGRLLTIGCFSYYKIDKENNIFYLYQCFNNSVMYPCKLWVSDNFWINFFKIEMNEANNKEDELFKNYDINNDFDNDKSIIEFKSKYAILLENSLYMSKIMYKLNLNKIFIVNVFEKMILPIYEYDYYNINNIMKNIFNLFSIK